MLTQLAKGIAPFLLLPGLTLVSEADTARAGNQAAGLREDRHALAEAVAQLCGKEIALLGEAAHGDGHTDSFKVALVEQLVTKCHYNAVFFEGSYYQFESIARARRAGNVVTPDMVGTAVGGLWKFDQEFQPLLPFLAREVTAGHLALGGIDFQVGGLEQPFANETVPAELTGYLDGDRRIQCRQVITARIYNGYDPSRQAELLQCVADISRSIQSTRVTDAKLVEEQSAMLANIKRYFEVDEGDTALSNEARDGAMFDIFSSLKNRLPPHSKVIVWAHNAHVAKDGVAFRRVSKNFGSYVHKAYGDRAYALGFTAYGGSFRWAKRDNRPIPPAPAESIEARAFPASGSGSVFLNQSRLRRIGESQAALDYHAYRTENWSNALDGIVVFRTEHPPHSTRPGY